MASLDELVDDIESRLTALNPNDFVDNGRIRSPIEIIALKLPMDDLEGQLAGILGTDALAIFFKDCWPEPKRELFSFLLKTIAASVSVQVGMKMLLNREKFRYMLKLLAESVQAGKMDYSFTLHVTSIAIDEPFDLAKDVRVQKIPEQIVAQKYPLDRQHIPVSQMTERYWSKQCVEVEILKSGTPADFRRACHIEAEDAMVNSILNSFLLALDIFPSVTHTIFSSPIQTSLMDRGVRNMVFEPRLLTAPEIERLKTTYAFLQDLQNDRILEVAVDRFIIGKKRNLHHPNRVNQPNWDKIVDYVIAMETLFLTVEGHGASQELSYRFSLNGSSLLRRCTATPVRDLFLALKSIYDMRSRVVHGEAADKVLGIADKFVTRLGIDSDNRKHPLGRLMLVANQVEEWLRKSFLFLADIRDAKRPYKASNGWENLLWEGSADAGGIEIGD